MTDIRNAILALIPAEHFITDDLKMGDETRPPLAQRDTRRVVIYLKRTTIGPFVNRQDNEGDTIRARIRDEDHIRVPARKWKSIEKVRSLQLCRAYGLIDEKYLYNEVDDTGLLANPMSVVFGDSAAGAGDSAGIPSLAVYEQGISIQPVREATERLQHNALGEAGTMWNVGKEKGFRSSLFDTLYVKEGTVFLQSITLDGPTPEALGLILMALDANRYGAGKMVLGANMQNEVIGILATRNEPPVTAYTVLEKASPDPVSTFLKDAQSWGGHWVPGPVVEQLRAAIRANGEGRAALMRALAEEAKRYHLFVYGEKKAKPRGKKAIIEPGV